MWNVCAMQTMQHESTDNTEDIMLFLREDTKLSQKINIYRGPVSKVVVSRLLILSDIIVKLHHVSKARILSACLNF